MTHPLEAKLDRLRRCLRRWLVVYGASRLVAALVGSLIILGMVDYVFRFEDPGMRLMLTGTLLAVLGWACYRWVYRPATARLGRVELARYMGRRFAELGDDLPGAIEFLHQSENDPVAGSPDLRKAVIAETESKAQKIDFATALDRRPAARGIILAVGVCLVAGILFLLDTLSCQIALARLTCPLSNVTWPRKHDLHLVDRVDRVARGQPFEVEVVDRGGKLPARVEIHYRSEGPDGGKAVEQTQPMRRVGSTMVARRENVSRPFAYRVQGGDDRSMRWIDVEVVEPPAVQSLRATIHPPPYSGRPTTQSTGPLNVLRGSRVEIEAMATKPLESARLRLEDGKTFECHLDKDGRRFYVGDKKTKGFVPDKSGHYGFELVDREDICGGMPDRWEITVIEDQPPVVRLERPAETAFVTPGATLPVRVTAQDDLALHRIELITESSETEPKTANEQPKQDIRAARAITLHEGPARIATGTDTSQGQRQTVDYRWNLADLALKPGESFSFHALAEDYQPQSGISDSRRVVVVRPEELIDRLADRQQAILAELGRALNLEQDGCRQVGQIRDAMTGSMILDQSAVDRLRSAELVQREVDRILTDHAGGVPGQVDQLLADLMNNRLDSPDVERRMEALLVELDRLGRKVLPVVSREVTAVIKAAEQRLDAEPTGGTDINSTPSETSLETSLSAALAGQNEVIATLERLLGRLNQWSDYRQFHQRLARLLRRQETLAERTLALDRDLIGKLPEDLSPEATARLAAVANDQLELARHLDQLLQEMDQSRAALEKRDPLAAETILDVLARSRELDIRSKMREAGTSASRNRLGRAKTLQAEIIDDLREILNLLSNRRGDELARLADKLPEAEGQLAELIRRQKALRERMEQKSAEPLNDRKHPAEWKSLGRQQDALREVAERFADRLTQLLAKRPAESVRVAAEQMGQASRAATAIEAAAAIRHAVEAETLLRKAARRLDQHLRKIQVDSAAQQMAELAATINTIHERQAKVAEQTKQLDHAFQNATTKKSAQLTALRRLAVEQRALERETLEITDDLSGARVFRRVLDEVAHQMAIAAGWLGRRQTDSRAQTAQQAALEHLARLAKSLRVESADSTQTPEPNGQQADQGAKQNGQQPHPGAVAQLRLLKMLEQDLFVRTQAWQKRFGGQSPLPPEAQREYKQLSQEQGELADLLFELIRKSTEQNQAPQDNPGNQP